MKSAENTYSINISVLLFNKYGRLNRVVSGIDPAVSTKVRLAGILSFFENGALCVIKPE
jgi:hypothetical protein